MSDLKLLEMAAKAAGIKHVDYDGVSYDGSAGLVIMGEHGQHLHGWNPLADDGDALRLAFTLEMGVDMYGCIIGHSEDSQYEFENTTGDLANVRRAIVEVAAYLAKVAA